MKQLWIIAVILIWAAGCEHGGGGSVVTILPGDQPGFPFLTHVGQPAIASGEIRFQAAFELGDGLFEAPFNAIDGVGALVLPDGTPLPGRFSRLPPGGGRVTGPNAQACIACHNAPFPTSAGEAVTNVLQDPRADGVGPFNVRNTTTLFGSGVLQRLAEEITEELHATRDAAAAAALPGGPPVARDLAAKGIAYGRIVATRAAGGAVALDVSGVRGVDPDLVVRPYGWKGNTATLRDFVRGAARNEIGMEGDEVVAKGPPGNDDPDGDGVAGELTVGDVTALTLYVAGQPVPTSADRLARDGLAPPPPEDIGRLAERGRAVFGAVGCASCHVPELRLADPVFEEPTLRGRGKYLDPDLDAAATAYDPARPARFDLIREGEAPRLVPHPDGGAKVGLFADLRRHDMGRRLADAQLDAPKGADGRRIVFEGTPLSISRTAFLTTELWGVANSGPWMHDGRAASLEEAILLHGEDAPPPLGDPMRSEAQEARDAFLAGTPEDRLALVEFLKTLVHFKFADAEEE